LVYPVGASHRPLPEYNRGYDNCDQSNCVIYVNAYPV
jgi:hypothetical protein